MNTKISKLICLCTLILFIFSCKRQDTTNDQLKLEEGWKISTSDSIRFSSPDYNDRHWRILSSDKSIDFQQHQDIFWYRIKVIIPSLLYKNSYFKDSLQFSLGTLKGFDQTFLNGFPLGQIGEVFETAQPFDERIKDQMNHKQAFIHYKLAINDPRILWDQINTLSIRVLPDSGFEGFNCESASISMIDLKDYIFFNLNKEDFVYIKGHYSKEIELVNTLNKSFTGHLSIIVLNNENQEIIYKNEEKIKIEAGSVFLHFFAFRASDTGDYQIRYSFLAKNAINKIEETELLTDKN